MRQCHQWKKGQLTIPITAEELSIPEEKLRLDVLREVFIKAEEIKNSPNGVTATASSNQENENIKEQYF